MTLTVSELIYAFLTHYIYSCVDVVYLLKSSPRDVVYGNVKIATQRNKNLVIKNIFIKFD